MCGSMADIQSPAAEIRRGKKKEEEDRRKETTAQKCNGPLLHRAAIKNYSLWSKVGKRLQINKINSITSKIAVNVYICKAHYF